MRIETVDPKRPDPEVLRGAAELLRSGGLVAFPTETVYGLGANALDPAAVQRIFEAKGRPSYNPLIAHVGSVDEARALALHWPADAEVLARHFWPGPLTLVVPKRPDIPDLLTAGLATVAIRVPAHPVAQALLRAVGLPIAAPSANRFTELSPTQARHVAKGLGDRVDLILDGGPTAVGIESTVVDVSGDGPVLLRPGTLARAELEAVVGPVRAGGGVEGDAPRPAPGMVARHYSPRARLRIFARRERAVMEGAAVEALESGQLVGAILLEALAAPVQHAVEMPREAGAYARELYSTLHRLDDAGCELIVVDAVPEGAEWAGVRDRLARASHQD